MTIEMDKGTGSRSEKPEGVLGEIGGEREMNLGSREGLSQNRFAAVVRLLFL